MPETMDELFKRLEGYPSYVELKKRQEAALIKVQDKLADLKKQQKDIEDKIRTHEYYERELKKDNPHDCFISDRMSQMRFGRYER